MGIALLEFIHQARQAQRGVKHRLLTLFYALYYALLLNFYMLLRSTGRCPSEERAMSELLNTVEAAHRLRLNPQTLNRWRRQGTGPAYVRVGKKVMYLEEQITTWLAAHREIPGEPEALADMKLPLFPSFAGDPVALQRAMRDEWDR
jgi:predicted DNA-binding transcriptional regulator AlpA